MAQIAGIVSLASVASLFACGSGAPATTTQVFAAQGGLEISLKVDFDTGQNPFAPTDVARADLIGSADGSLSGRSLLIRRAKEGHYIGASVPLRATGAKDLRIAFMARATAMQWVSVNVFDRRHQDNTTPASPARVFDDDWHPVVFRAEDFHYNSDPPDQKIELIVDYASLMFHGQEDGPSASMGIDKLVIYRGHDATPPAAPTAVRASPAADGSVEITWQEPADNTFAAVYSIHRKGSSGTWEKVGESVRPVFHDRPGPQGAYSYRVTAADYENNVSPPSSEVAASTTSAGPTKAMPGLVEADRAIYADHVREVHTRGAGRVQPDVFLFAGDSITAATLYTHALGSWLARGLTVRQGVGTVTTAYGAAHIKTYLADAQPEFAIVMYGTNDQLSNVPLADGMTNLAAIIDACVEAGTIPVVATIPPRGYDKKEQQAQERFNRALSELARKKQIPVSYVFEEMMSRDLKEMLGDGVHLQPLAGNDAAGRALRKTMDQVYFALRAGTAG